MLIQCKLVEFSKFQLRITNMEKSADLFFRLMDYLWSLVELYWCSRKQPIAVKLDGLHLLPELSWFFFRLWWIIYLLIFIQFSWIESHQCLLTGTCKKMLGCHAGCQDSAGVTPEVNLRKWVTCMPLPSVNKAAHSSFEIQSQKRFYHWPHKKHLYTPKN